MPFCTNCGKEAQISDNFCQYCGAPIIQLETAAETEDKTLDDAAPTPMLSAALHEEYKNGVADDAAPDTEPQNILEQENDTSESPSENTSEECPKASNNLFEIASFIRGRGIFAIEDNKLRTLFWFTLTNIAVVMSLYVVTGFDQETFSFCGTIMLIGFTVPFIMLFAAKSLIKRTHPMLKEIIPGRERNDSEKAFTQLIESLCRRAGLEKMPEIWIYDSQDMNAFASGPGRTNAMIAFSSALISNMDQQAIAGVAAHEISHIANGDMLTLALVQGAVNAFIYPLILFWNLLLILAHAVCTSNSSFLTWLAQTLLSLVQFAVTAILLFLGSLVVKAFSRTREFRADEAAARLIDKGTMIHTLEKLGEEKYEMPQLQKAYAAMKISAPSAVWDIFSTHPSLPRRIERLRQINTL